jgi:hypothetical protein
MTVKTVKFEVGDHVEIDNVDAGIYNGDHGIVECINGETVGVRFLDGSKGDVQRDSLAIVRKHNER